MHNWTINLNDGGARAPDKGCTTTFTMQVQVDEVTLNAKELRTLATDLDKASA